MTSTPFTQGSEAFYADASTTTCQFPQGSTMHREWMDGWSQRQVRERAHRSRAIATMNISDLLGAPSAGAMAELFYPITEMN